MPERRSSKPRGGPSGRTPSYWLNTTGNQTLGIGICTRCQFKFPLGELVDDPNIPNFKVCKWDRDDYDPYRMPARSPDVITLPFVRPDVALSTPPVPEWEE